MSLGRILLLTISLHCLQKKSLNILAFSLQLRMNLLSKKSGGILGAADLFNTLFISFQYDFWQVSGLCSLLPIFLR